MLVGAPASETAQRQKSLTIGAVCKALAQEFPDISISKIRYLEDQKLLAPRRTPGGYRLYTQGDVARLRTILRMQRDEFLPLAVIRDMLTQGVSRPTGTRRRRARALAQADRQLTLEDLVGETDADLRFIQELEEYGLLEGRRTGLPKPYTRTDVEIVALCQRLARYGVGGRNLRVFRSSADREANLLQQILAPALRSRNPQRRKEAVEALENLAAVATHLKHLLLVRDLRKIIR